MLRVVCTLLVLFKSAMIFVSDWRRAPQTLRGRKLENSDLFVVWKAALILDGAPLLWECVISIFYFLSEHIHDSEKRARNRRRIAGRGDRAVFRCRAAKVKHGAGWARCGCLSTKPEAAFEKVTLRFQSGETPSLPFAVQSPSMNTVIRRTRERQAHTTEAVSITCNANVHKRA